MLTIVYITDLVLYDLHVSYHGRALSLVMLTIVYITDLVLYDLHVSYHGRALSL